METYLCFKASLSAIIKYYLPCLEFTDDTKTKHWLLGGAKNAKNIWIKSFKYQNYGYKKLMIRVADAHFVSVERFSIIISITGY